MIRNRFYLAVFFFGAFFPCLASAQDDDLGTVTSSLQDVLSNLKQSVDKLSVDNDQLSLKDNSIKQQVVQLETQLNQLQGQEAVLDKQAARLQEINPGRASQITRLEGENLDLDNHIQKTEAAIKLVEQSMDAGWKEDQKLLLQLKGMSAAPAAPPQPVLSQSDEQLQKEKLKLMKMVYESQQRQEALHQSIIDLQKNMPLQPAASAMARQQVLKGQIEDLESQLAASPPPAASAGDENQWDGEQLHQLEAELKTMEHNYSQLKILMDQMNKKAQNAKMTAGQQAEAEKLQGTIDDLNRQGDGLRADLDDLRSQLIDLDKRKSHLQEIVSHLP